MPRRRSRGSETRGPLWRLGMAAGTLAVLVAGCTTTSRDVHQFKPVPVARVGAVELEPAAPPSAMDLLRAAEEAFRAANAAQEKGDHEAALRQYTLMLEMLIEADLDPAIFYNLRNEFDSILTSTSQQAPLYERMRPAFEGEVAYGPGIMGDLPIKFPLNERVLTEIGEIQNVQPYTENFQAGLNRSAKYGPYIRSELAKAGLPKDLMWLAMVESQFTPKIISRAGAGGMWQFMRSTGRRYNLRIDYYVDERFHWQKCTQAAITYLKDLYELFGSWPLAISAYNMGEGGIERAIAANGGERDLWTLLDTPPAAYHIRRETKKFYPKLLATIIIANNPERYGFTLEPQAPDPCVSVPVKGPYSLAALDKACGLPSGTLGRLNPHLIRGVSPSGTYEITVPTDMRTKMLAALKKVPRVTYASGEPGVHVVRPGETISHISQRYRVSAKELMRINKIRSARRLQVGKRLTIPGHASAVGGSAGSVRTHGGSHIYQVKSGDTLYDIAKAEKVTVDDLQKWNNLGGRSRIHIGQRLYVSPPSASSASGTGTKQNHVVRAGEYPAKIARRYGVQLEDFLRWNKLTKTSKIMIGDKLVVYTDGPPEAANIRSSGPKTKAALPPGAAKIIHKVAQGDNASVIAAKYGVRTTDVLAWNALTARSILHIGDECVVYVAPEGVRKRAQSAEAPPSPPEATPSKPEEDAERIVHIVATGQNPTTIARRYGVRLSQLFDWNGWKKAPILHIGDEVVIYKNK